MARSCPNSALRCVPDNQQYSTICKLTWMTCVEFGHLCDWWPVTHDPFSWFISLKMSTDALKECIESSSPNFVEGRGTVWLCGVGGSCSQGKLGRNTWCHCEVLHKAHHIDHGFLSNEKITESITWWSLAKASSLNLTNHRKSSQTRQDMTRSYNTEAYGPYDCVHDCACSSFQWQWW